MSPPIRWTYIWSQLNPKSNGKFAIKSKFSEIIKFLNPSGSKSQINTNEHLYRMANTFIYSYNRLRGSNPCNDICKLYISGAKNSNAPRRRILDAQKNRGSRTIAAPPPILPIFLRLWFINVYKRGKRENTVT